MNDSRECSIFQEYVIKRQRPAQLRNIRTKTHIDDIVSNVRWTAFLIQITTGKIFTYAYCSFIRSYISLDVCVSGGHIRVFRRGQDSIFKLASEATDSEPIPVEYVSLASWSGSHSKFFFNCSHSLGTIEQLPTKKYHPLLLQDDVPPTIDFHTRKVASSIVVSIGNYIRTFVNIVPILTVLISKCLYYKTTTYEYEHFTRITDIKNSSPEMYLLRMVFYIQSATGAYILLSTSNRPNYEMDSVYELGNSYLSLPKLISMNK